MMVPRERLVLWSGVVGASCVLAAAADPRWALPAAAAGALFAAVVLLDAWVSRGRLAGLRLQFPGDARLTCGRSGEVELLVDGSSSGLRRLRLALAWPEGFAPERRVMEVALPADAPGRLLWPCVADRRGHHRIAFARAETPSRLGFWDVRRSLPLDQPVRVYPDLSAERRSMAAVFLNRGLAGVHVRRMVGKGREVEKLREYLPGDSYEDIHWKATARRARPVTKTYQIERSQEVYVVMDTSRLSARPASDTEDGTGPPLLDRFITAALLLGMVAGRQGDLFGVAAFDDRVRAFVRAGGGPGHHAVVRDAVFALAPAPVNPDFGELCAFLRLRLRRRALVILLTSLDDPVLSEEFMRNMEPVFRKHLVLVNTPVPPGVGRLFSEEAREGEDLHGRLAGHYRWRQLRELEFALRRRGVGLQMLDDARMCPQMAAQYLGARQRQLL